MAAPSGNPLAAVPYVLGVAAVAIAAPSALGQVSVEQPGAISPVAVASLQLEQDSHDLAGFPRAMETFAISDRTYLLAVGRLGAEILDVTDPRFPVPVADMRSGDAPRNGYSPAAATFAASGGTYAMTATSDAIKIINVTIPDSPAVAAEIRNGHDNAHVLRHLPPDLVEERLGPYQAARTMSYSWNDLEAVDTFADTSGNVYALLASRWDDKVLVVDVTVPEAPVLMADMRDSREGFYALDDPVDVDAFVQSGRAYALVSSSYGAMQVANLTNPGAPTPAASVRDGQDGLHPRNVHGGAEVFAVQGKTYALTHGYGGARIVDVTDPGAPAPAASIAGDWSSFGNMIDVGVFGVSGAMYALAHYDYGIRVIDVTDPGAPTSVADMRDEWDRRAYVYAAAVFASSGGTYALVADSKYDAVRVIDIGEPAAPEHVAELSGEFGPSPPWGAVSVDVELLASGGGTYALVADAADNVVRVVDITEPAAPRHVTDVSGGVDGFHAMSGPQDVATFAVSGAGYALVAGGHYGAVQVLDFTDAEEPIAAAEIWDGTGGLEVFEASGHTYAILLSDNSAHIINATEPAAASTVSGAGSPDGRFGHGESAGIAIVSAAEGVHAISAPDFGRTMYVVDITDVRTPVFLDPADTDAAFSVYVDPTDVEAFHAHGRAYVIITGHRDFDSTGTVQIIDVTLPRSASQASMMTSGQVGSAVHDAPIDVEVFEILDRTYALVVGYDTASGGAMLVLDVTDAKRPAVVASATSGNGVLDAGMSPMGAEIFATGGVTYAVLVDAGGSALQVVALTPPDA